jgi:CheY-like chemotaxis protein
VKKARVLLVDDERRIIECFTAVLESADFEVSTACSAAEAAATLRGGSFDVVITDMAMETPTAGYDVARVAQEQPHPPAIIVLTAFLIPADEWKEKGIRALFLKGGQTVARLLDAISAIITESRIHRPLNDQVRRLSGV